MTVIRVRRVVDAPVSVVWDELADIPSHVEWMAEAVSLDFTGDQRRGAGTSFDCATKVGPFRTRDRMTVTEWREGRSIGVRHAGLVTGEGLFTIRRALRSPGSRTVITWREQLRFPWYFGGPIGGLAAKPVLKRIWRGNLDRLAARCQARI